MLDCITELLLSKGVVDNIVSTIILTLLFFLFKEKIFFIPKIGGIWYLKQITTETAYNPYNKMELQYMLSIRVEGNKIYGSAEKIYEDSSFGMGRKHVIHYEGKYRVICELEGFVQKKYIIGNDILVFQLFEENEKRKSTTYYEIQIRKRWYFVGEYVFVKGNFQSTIANQKGTFTMSKTEFHKAEKSI